ncbi:MAG: acyl-CoA desaturase [Acidobacteria bacterium]|nr:acyl-CoA desaturase [Acidobacteriota bacterium]MBI3657576.1 acyl-CoA desaturase [Acidobacteriota bacterium]
MKGLKVRYDPSTVFYEELKRRVDDYFKTTGRSPRDIPRMYVKTVIFLSWFAVSYGLLVFVASTGWQGLLLAISVGLAMAGIGFNVQHDGGHGAYSHRRFVNRSMAMMLDIVGASSYLWRWKHNFFHHNYPNIAGADEDIDLGPLGHLSPDQPLYHIHRFQYLYLWVLYGFLPFKWQVFDDFRDWARGKIGEHRVPRPQGWDVVVLLGGKVLFFGLAFGIPALFHSLRDCVVFYAVASFTLGVTLSVVFQLAHCVEEASFSKPLESTNRMEKAWAVHQVETTVDFARSNRLLTWYLGGLNFQIEHHLFPGICHVHYPAISAIVESVCAQFGVRYSAHTTARGALASHFRLLRMDRLRSPELVAGRGTDDAMSAARAAEGRGPTVPGALRNV